MFGLSLVRTAALLLVATSSAGRIEAQGDPAIAPGRPGLVAVPSPTLQRLESPVAAQLATARQAFVALMANAALTDGARAAAYGELGRLYHAYEFLDAAEASYRNAVMLAPLDFRWVHLLGRLYEQASRLDEAATEFERARRLRPSYAATAVRLGQIYLQQGRTDEARSQFRQAVALDPNSGAAHSGLGEVALVRSEYANAIKSLLHALTLVPAANRLHYPLAMAYRGVGDTAKAREHLEQRGMVGVRAVDPLVDELETLVRGERVHLLRGEVAFKAKRLTEAVEAFTKAVEAAADSVQARVNLAAALSMAGDENRAVDHLEQALRIDPKNVTAHFNLGTLLVRRGRHEDAIRHLRVAVETGADDADARRLLAQALVATGRYGEAERHLSTAHESDPADEETLVALADLLSREGRYHQALDRLERAHAQFPHHERTANALARLLAASPDASLRNGQRALELALALFDARPVVAYGESLAMALAELGRCDEAAQRQRGLVVAAERAGERDVVAALRAALARYERGAPCRPPVSSDPQPQHASPSSTASGSPLRAVDGLAPPGWPEKLILFRSQCSVSTRYSLPSVPAQAALTRFPCTTQGRGDLHRALLSSEGA